MNTSGCLSFVSALCAATGFALLSANSVSATDVPWTGAADAYLDNPANWANATLPATNDTAVFSVPITGGLLTTGTNLQYFAMAFNPQVGAAVMDLGGGVRWR